METVIACFSLCFYLILLPGLLGLCLYGRRAFALPGGMLLELAVFQLGGLPFVFFGRSLSELTLVLNLIFLGLIPGLFFLFGRARSLFSSEKKSAEEKKSFGIVNRKGEVLLLWGIFLLLLLFELDRALRLASFDGDDAYYVAQSVACVEQDSLYRVIPYTGFATELDMRHAMAIFPVWIAFLSRMSGVHPAILCHSILPLLLIPGAYVFYGLLFRELVEKNEEEDKRLLPAFLILTALLQLFGAVSIYTPAAFFTARTWQGKAVLAGILLPAMLWLLFRAGKRKEVNRDTALLLITLNITAALMSSMGIFLTALMLGAAGTFLGIYYRSPKLFIRLAVCSLPCVVYAVLYLML